MRVTHVNLRVDLIQQSGSRLRAVGSITLDDVFQIEYIRIVQAMDGQLIVAMPSIRNTAGEHRDTAHPLRPWLRKHINDCVLTEYQKLVKALTNTSPSVNITS